MSRLARFRNRLAFRRRRAELDRDLAEEIAYHAEMKQAEARRAGLAPAEAEALSRREMGNLTLACEQCHEAWSFTALETLFQDFRHALRIFRKTPGLTAVAVLSLAVGIGGNAAMFGLVNQLLIRPLPYRAPERIVRLTGIYPRAAVPFFQQRTRTMDVAAVSAGAEFNLTGEGPASRIFGYAASANLFAVLGSPAAIGRTFDPGEDSPGRDAVAILAHSLWETRFNRDPAVLARVIRLNGVDRQVVGVMPPGFGFPSAKAQVWIPMRLNPSNFLEFWGEGFVPMLGALRPGATVQQAHAEVRALVSQFRATFPYPMARDWNADSAAIPLQQDIVGDIRGRLLILLASVALVLLIACANVASLLLSRAAARRKEIALRAALGAGRLRIVRQLLTESVVLALAGGASGILLGIGVLSVFRSVLPPDTPGLAQAAIDWPVAAAIAALAILTGLAFGLAPAIGASRIDLNDSIRTGSPRSAGKAWTRLRSSLIAGEVALTVVLVAGAGLLIRSLYTLSETRPGFEPERVLTVRISPNQSMCAQRPACIALYTRLLDETRALPGVSGAALAASAPLDGRLPTLAVDVEGHPKSPGHPAPILFAGAVTPGYLRTMRIPLLAGRDLSEADTAESSGVVLVSAATARRFWPGENPVGKHVKATGERQWRTVVGVVAGVRQFSLSRNLPDFVPGAMYMPYAQSVREDLQIPAAMTLLVRTAAAPERLMPDIRRLARDLSPDVPAGEVQPLADIVSASISDFRATIRVFLSFAGAAILLAAIGIYGLVSNWVSQRTYEIGLRVAVGASRPRIVSMILGQGLRVALCGAAAGLAAALALTRFLSALLYGVAANDPLTFAAVAALVLAVAAAASALPAWRASRIDPVKSLRAE